MYLIHILFYTAVYNNKILVKFNLLQNPPIIMGVVALFQLNCPVGMYEKWFPFLLKRLVYLIHFLYIVL